MAPTLVASYFVQQNTTASTALTTPSFTPSNGEVIIVKLGTWSTNTAMGAPTGGSQTYTSQIINAPGGFNSWCGIYSAVISGSPGSMTISSTPAASARYSMTVERWSGAQLAATPVTNSATGTGAAAAGTITPSAGTSIISWCSGDAQSIDPATRAYLGSGTDEGVRDGHSGANGVEYYGYQASTGTSSQSYGLSAPSGQTFVIAAIEVQASGAATATWVPAPATRRRPQLGRRAPHAGMPIPAQAAPVTPSPARGRVKTPRTARARAVAAPVAQTVPAPVQRPRLKLPKIFRGRAGQTVPAQVAVTAPAYLPPPVRIRLRLLGRFRGRVAAVVPAQVVVPPPVFPPQNVRARVRGLRLFRGRTAAVVPAQVAAPPPAYVPPAMRVRPKLLRLFRGRAAVLPPAQPMVPVAARVRPRPALPRRGRTAAVIPAQAVAVAPAYVPSLSRIRARLARFARGAARFAAWPAGTSPPVVAPRTPTVTVDLARAAPSTDLARATATADLTRPSVQVDL